MLPSILSCFNQIIKKGFPRRTQTGFRLTENQPNFTVSSIIEQSPYEMFYLSIDRSIDQSINQSIDRSINYFNTFRRRAKNLFNHGWLLEGVCYV